MKITILGSGNSGGVPLIGNDWGACDKSNIKNRRRRPSVMVEEGATRFLVDTSPDLREQLIDCGADYLSAIFYTHAHADHTHGIDDLRAMNWLMNAPIDVYSNQETLDELRKRFGYAFYDGPEQPKNFYRPVLRAHVLAAETELGGVRITHFEQEHGKMTSLGYRFDDFAYSTDAHTLDDAAFAALSGVKIWVVDCIREAEHPTHSHLAQTLAWIERVKPERAILTHMDQSMDYDSLRKKLPHGVEPAYDGMVIAL